MFKAFSKISILLKNHVLNYPTPISLNFLWNFGFLAGICLLIQLVSGIFLAMHYSSEMNYAFQSVEFIMRQINYGWLIRYIHSNGASMFLFIVYVHMLRGVYFKLYRFSNIKVWISGVLIFYLLMATAFLGYVLPWGQMSSWGATVITNMVSAIPVFGQTITLWLWGGFAVGNPTLVRFFVLHFVLPFVVSGLVMLHLYFLHERGSHSGSLTLGSSVDNVVFYPYFVLKDFFGLTVFLFFFGFLVFFEPNLLGHPDNYIKANPIVTPSHIVPEWYFLPFYTMLRAVPSKIGGVLYMFGALGILLLLPFGIYFQKVLIWVLGCAIVKNNQFFNWSVNLIKRFRFWGFIHDVFFSLFIGVILLLGWFGSQPVEKPFWIVSAHISILYFLYFFYCLIIL